MLLTPYMNIYLWQIHMLKMPVLSLPCKFFASCHDCNIVTSLSATIVAKLEIHIFGKESMKNFLY